MLIDEEQFDSVYLNLVTPFFVDAEGIAKQIVEVNQARRKPLVCNLMTDKRQWAETVRILKEGGVPCYSFPGTAARALVAFTMYNTIRSREIGAVKTFADVDRRKAEAILQQAA